MRTIIKSMNTGFVNHINLVNSYATLLEKSTMHNIHCSGYDKIETLTRAIDMLVGDMYGKGIAESFTLYDHNDLFDVEITYTFTDGRKERKYITGRLKSKEKSKGWFKNKRYYTIYYVEIYAKRFEQLTV